MRVDTVISRNGKSKVFCVNQAGLIFIRNYIFVDAAGQLYAICSKINNWIGLVAVMSTFPVIPVIKCLITSGNLCLFPNVLTFAESLTDVSLTGCRRAWNTVCSING